jgi:hypothetical protein
LGGGGRGGEGGESLAAVKFLVLEYAEHDRNLWLGREGEGQPRRGARGRTDACSHMRHRKICGKSLKSTGTRFKYHFFDSLAALSTNFGDSGHARDASEQRVGRFGVACGGSRERAFGGEGGASPGPEETG